MQAHGHRVALAGPLRLRRRGREERGEASGKERGEDERMITLPWLMWTRRSVDPGFPACCATRTPGGPKSPAPPGAEGARATGRAPSSRGVRMAPSEPSRGSAPPESRGVVP
jgi:hypothetical protein